MKTYVKRSAYLLLVASLNILMFQIISPRYNLYRVRRHLDASLSELVPLPESSLSHGSFSEDFIDRYNSRCHFARERIVISFADTPSELAVANLDELLVASGWVYLRNEYRYDENLSLQIIVYDVPILELNGLVDYERLRENYETVLTIRVEYNSPNRWSFGQT